MAFGVYGGFRKTTTLLGGQFSSPLSRFREISPRKVPSASFHGSMPKKSELQVGGLPRTHPSSNMLEKDGPVGHLVKVMFKPLEGTNRRLWRALGSVQVSISCTWATERAGQLLDNSQCPIYSVPPYFCWPGPIECLACDGFGLAPLHLGQCGKVQRGLGFGLGFIRPLSRGFLLSRLLLNKSDGVCLSSETKHTEAACGGYFLSVLGRCSMAKRVPGMCLRTLSP